jgi:hypothetical protein
MGRWFLGGLQESAWCKRSTANDFGQGECPDSELAYSRLENGHTLEQKVTNGGRTLLTKG